jgi:predicted N-acetyltransferase YhbS
MRENEMPSLSIHVRRARADDLDAINRVIEAAVMTWNLPERVKRLSLSSYLYTTLDFKHLDMAVAEGDEQNIVGVAAWEPADSRDMPAGEMALLLHGIYVDPSHHQQGVGSRLFREAERVVLDHPYSGLLVKAQEDAIAFFLAQGMIRLQADDPERHYANRFWKSAEDIVHSSGRS